MKLTPTILVFLLGLTLASGALGGGSRVADLRLAIPVADDAKRELVLEALDGFAMRYNLRITDQSRAASNVLDAETIVRFYEDDHRAVVMVTDRLGRDRLLVGAHNAERGGNSSGFDDALLRYLRKTLSLEIIVNPAE